MDRRNFFRSALQKSGQSAVKAADALIEKQAGRWIRPPFALDELQFILTCTRCRDCIDACPYGVIFPLSARTGAKFAATPALDLLNKGCHCCEDWPCVAACEANALQLPEADSEAEIQADAGEAGASRQQNTPPPTMALASIDAQTCLPYSGPECGVCLSVCPVPGALTLVELSRPVIDASLCCGCGLCRENCIVSPRAITIAPVRQQA